MTMDFLTKWADSMKEAVAGRLMGHSAASALRVRVKNALFGTEEISMNKYQDILNLLGIRFDSPYMLKSADDGLVIVKNAIFQRNGKIVDETNAECTSYLVGLVRGDIVAVSLEPDTPFPNYGDEYWYVRIKDGGERLSVFVETFDGYNLDYEHFMTGNCFRTREEAEQHKETIARKLINFYENRGKQGEA